MKKRSLKISMVASPFMILCGVMGSGPSAWGQSATGACTDQILSGDYGFAIEGVVLPAPGVALPIRGVAMTRFDGAGGLSQVDHVIINGEAPAIDWNPGIGTYHINPDCTGTMRINVPSTRGFVNLRIVVSGRGRIINTVVTAPFDGPARTVTSIGTRRDF